jgi:hypothetical protein
MIEETFEHKLYMIDFPHLGDAKPIAYQLPL